MLVSCIFDALDITEIEKAEAFVADMKRRLEGDPLNTTQLQETANGHDQPQGQPDDSGEDYRSKVQEIAALECGELLRGAFRYFPDEQFDITQLAPLMEKEVSTLHSWAAQLGKSCKHRGIEVFQRHGGSPLKLSIRPDVRQILRSAMP